MSVLLSLVVIPTSTPVALTTSKRPGVCYGGFKFQEKAVSCQEFTAISIYLVLLLHVSPAHLGASKLWELLHLLFFLKYIYIFLETK